MPNRTPIRIRHRRTRPLSRSGAYPRRPRVVNNDEYLDIPNSPETTIRANALAPSLSTSAVSSPLDRTSLPENILNEQLIRHQMFSETNYEEDSDEYTNWTSDSNDLPVSTKSTQCELPDDELEGSDLEWINKHCVNCTNAITVSPFTKEDFNDILTIKIQNTAKKFDKGTCLTKNDIIGMLTADLKSNLSTPNIDPFNDNPTSIMAIWTTPKKAKSLEELSSGMSGYPTGKLVFKIPILEIYVTLGSIKRLLHSGGKDWYALPLFGGKRRRIGNLLGTFGSSMNHGQIPGFVVYKLYTKSEIAAGVEATENRDDYPLSLYIHDNTQPLLEVIGYYSPNIYKHVYTSIIKDLVSREL